MTARHITLDGAAEVLLVSSEYNDEIRLTIKSFPGARWDGERRLWRVPLEHGDRLLSQLARFEFEVAPEVVELGGDPPEAPDDDTLSVSQVNQRIGATLVRGFPRSLWVRGEVASFDKVSRRRHHYFELIEKALEGDEVAARLPVVIFHRTGERIRRKLEQAAEPLALRDGLDVRLRGRLEYYSPQGRLQLVVDDIDPDFAFGELARRRRQILEELDRRGFIGRNAALAWPVLPLRVGLITASESDAFHDVIRTFERSAYAFEIVHRPAAVQGAQLETEVTSALDYFARHSEDIDVVLLVRGGGARSDLAWFDNVNVATRMALHPVKIVVGIGHERDRSVVDEVAASEKTPTAAAERVVARVAEAEATLAALGRQLVERTRRRLEGEKRRCHGHGARLRSGASARLGRARQRVERVLAVGLQARVRARLVLEQRRLSGFEARLRPERLLRGTRQLEARRLELERRLKTAVRAQLRASSQRLAGFETQVKALDPAETLARGFAIVHTSTGALVRTPADAPVQSRIDITLHRGALSAHVTAQREPEETP